MIHDEILSQPEHVRFEAFLKTWNTLTIAESFVQSQEEADRIATMYNVKAPRITAGVVAIGGGDDGGFGGGGWGGRRGL